MLLKRDLKGLQQTKTSEGGFDDVFLDVENAFRAKETDLKQSVKKVQETEQETTRHCENVKERERSASVAWFAC